MIAKEKLEKNFMKFPRKQSKKAKTWKREKKKKKLECQAKMVNI